jgi:sec-independent protein translocase protein TatA
MERILMRNPEIWIVLIIVGFLVFGAKRMPDAARGLGRSLRIFKAETKGLLTDDEQAAQPAQPLQIPAAPPVYQPPVIAPVAEPVYQQPVPAPVAAPAYQQPAPAPAPVYQQPAPAPAPVYQQPAAAPVYQQPVAAPVSAPVPAPVPAPAEQPPAEHHDAQ